MAKKTIKIKGLGIHEVDDLDHVLRTQFIPNFGENIDDEIDEISLDISYNFTPIAVDHVIEIMNKFKGIGATHVGMTHHVDHQGYLFEGYDIHEVDNKEYSDKQQAEINDTLNSIITHMDKLSDLKGKLTDVEIPLDEKLLLIKKFE